MTKSKHDLANVTHFDFWSILTKNAIFVLDFKIVTALN